MAKLSLSAAPTFVAKVGIPVAGAEPAMVELTFRHRTRSALSAWLEQGKDRADVDAILDLASGWDLPDEFNRDNVETLVQNYIGAPAVLVDFYIKELTKAKLGN